METAENVAAEPFQAQYFPPNPPPDPAPVKREGRKPWYDNPEITEKYTAFQLLRDQGFTVEKAAATLGYAESTGRYIERKLTEFAAKKANSGDSVGFLTTKRIERAASVVDKLMRAKKFGDIETIKDSTVLRAAECVLDRSDPKRSESGSGPSLSFVTINLGNMALPTPDAVPILDITPLSQGDTVSADGFISDGI